MGDVYLRVRQGASGDSIERREPGALCEPHPMGGLRDPTNRSTGQGSPQCHTVTQVTQAPTLIVRLSVAEYGLCDNLDGVNHFLIFCAAAALLLSIAGLHISCA